MQCNLSFFFSNITSCALWCWARVTYQPFLHLGYSRKYPNMNRSREHKNSQWYWRKSMWKLQQSGTLYWSSNNFKPCSGISSGREVKKTHPVFSETAQFRRQGCHTQLCKISIQQGWTESLFSLEFLWVNWQI